MESFKRYADMGRHWWPLLGVRAPLPTGGDFDPMDWPADVRVFSERMVVPPGIDGAEVMARLRARHLALAHWWVAHPKGRPSEVPPELRPSVLQPVSRETGAPDDLP